MMRKITGSEPVVHTHSCPEGRKGQVMTEEELRAFAVECLMDEYRQTGAEVTPLGPECGADFSIRNSRDGKVINTLVVCHDRPDSDIEGIDVSWLRDEYGRSGAWPRVTVACAWCLGGRMADGERPLPACGGDFVFIYNTVSALEGEENAPLEKRLTPVDLAVKFQEAWTRLDASVIAPYLDKDFHYGSDWVFDEMPCRKEFLEYLEGKFYTVRRTMGDPETGIFRNRRNGRVAVVLNQHGHTNMMEIISRDGRILSAHMGVFRDSFEEFDPKDDLYQGHGDHIGAIMDSGRFLGDWMQKSMDGSEVWKSNFTRVCMGEDTGDRRSFVMSMRYGDDTMSMLNVIAFDRKEQRNMYVTSYPMMKGTDLRVTVRRVREWDNMAEAAIECSAGDFDFAFFATDYYANKARYRTGREITVSLAALAMSAKEGQREFGFEGERALDWIERVGKHIGMNAEYDADGNVKPVRFSMEKLVSYIDDDTKAPDEARFQSPVQNIEDCSLMGVDFWKGDICVHVAPETDGRITVPLYFRKDFIPGVQDGDPVSGWLWMTGSISGLNGRDGIRESAGLTMTRFISFMDSIDFRRGFDNLTHVVQELPLVRIRDGYEFDAFKRGDDYGNMFQGYCCRAGSQKEYLPHTRGEKMTIQEIKDRKDATPYSDEYYIQDLHPCYEVSDIPSALEYVSVPFTEEGVLQAWLLENVHEFMPHAWHAGYDVKTFVTDEESLMDICTPKGFRDGDQFVQASQQMSVMEVEPLLPKVSITDDTAKLEICWWNDWAGLVKARITATRRGESFVFSEPVTEVLVPFDCCVCY